MVSSISLVDLKALKALNTVEESKQVGQNILKAFREIGFAYITNHGISISKVTLYS